mmetsp:Transcript_17649/g.45298  ORF Transcript_17649/g.45298 Transcript_17649/m.45298 type:complete len:273 (-) Transcript_17649:665-1483(-)
MSAWPKSDLSWVLKLPRRHLGVASTARHRVLASAASQRSSRAMSSRRCPRPSGASSKCTRAGASRAWSIERRIGKSTWPPIFRAIANSDRSRRRSMLATPPSSITSDGALRTVTQRLNARRTSWIRTCIRYSRCASRASHQHLISSPRSMLVSRECTHLHARARIARRVRRLHGLLTLRSARRSQRGAADLSRRAASLQRARNVCDRPAPAQRGRRSAVCHQPCLLAHGMDPPRRRARALAQPQPPSPVPPAQRPRRAAATVTCRSANQRAT